MADPREEGAARRYKKKQPSGAADTGGGRRAPARGGTITHGEGPGDPRFSSRGGRDRKGRQRKTKGSEVPQWPLEGATGLGSSANQSSQQTGISQYHHSHTCRPARPYVLQPTHLLEPLLMELLLGVKSLPRVQNELAHYSEEPELETRSREPPALHEPPPDQAAATSSVPLSARPAPSMALEQMLDTDGR